MEIAVKACRKVKEKKNTFWTGGIGGSKYTEFEIGETYKLPGPPVLCEKGFHYFRKEDLCFGTNLFGEDTVFIEIEVLGEVVSDSYKRVTNKIRVLRYIPEEEWKKSLDNVGNSGCLNSGSLNSGDYNSGAGNSGDFNSGNQNSGDWNTGNWNTGDYNTGDYNSGDYNSGSLNSGDFNSGDYNSGDQNSGDFNSGDWNTGNWNTGDYNSGDYNSGDFNSSTPETIRVFEKPCDRKLWDNCMKPNFLNFDLQEGETLQEAFQRSWDETSEEDRRSVESLPNFDWEIFTRISGIVKPENWD